MTELPYTVERYDNERDWLAARCDSIGGSEGSSVVGYNSFCGTLGLWVRKQERRIEIDDDDMPEMREAGKLHEPTIAKWFADKHDRLVSNPGDFTIYRSKERPHVTCTLDRYLGFVGEGMELLELKCAWFDAAKVWKEKIPITYQIQGQQQMYVTGAEVCHFACLLNGYQFRHLRLERNQRFIDRLMSRIDTFWFDHVQAGVEPPADFSPSSSRALAAMYPRSNGESIELDDDLADLCAEYDRVTAARAAADKKAKEIANTVKQFMGGAEAAVSPTGGGFTWREGAKGRTFRRNKNLKLQEQLA